MEVLIGTLCAIFSAGAGAGAALLLYHGRRQKGEQQGKYMLETDSPQAERLKVQFENFMAYDGTGRGQQHLEE